MYKLVRSIFVLMTILVIPVLTSCDWITKPEDELHHVVVMNPGAYDHWARCVTPDVSGQGGWYRLLAKTNPQGADGMVSFDLKEADRVIEFRDINAPDDGQHIERRITVHPDAVNQQYTHDGTTNLESYYDFVTGEYKP